MIRMKTFLGYTARILMLLLPVSAMATGPDSAPADKRSEKAPERLSVEVKVFENNIIPVDSGIFFNHVNQLESEIAMDYNAHVKRMIDFFGVEWQPKLKEMLTLSEHYFPIYEQILDKHDLPLELKYISVIESGLNPYAESYAGAVGLWQFMPYTGKIFDLDIDRYSDERRDIEKATDAAARYFKQMSTLYDDWLVVIASYNCGPGNVNKAIRKAGGKTGFWEIYPYLPRQTRNYIPSFIAVAYLMNFADDYGISPAPVDRPNYAMGKVSCSSEYSLNAISEVLNISVDSLKGFNPSLKSDYLPQNKTSIELRLPAELCYCFVEENDRIKEISKAYKAAIREEYHTVRRGESLLLISKKYGCSVSELKNWNNLNSALIHPGQKLVLYL